MTYTTTETNAETGEVIIREWTQDEIAARLERLMPLQWQALREERDKLLKTSDIYVLPDRWDGYDAATRAAWASYRQALRDLPANTADPANPSWPTQPN